MKAWTSDPTPQHVQLVRKNEDLHLLRTLAASAENEQLDQTAKPE